MQITNVDAKRNAAGLNRNDILNIIATLTTMATSTKLGACLLIKLVGVMWRLLSIIYSGFDAAVLHLRRRPGRYFSVFSNSQNGFVLYRRNDQPTLIPASYRIVSDASICFTFYIHRNDRITPWLTWCRQTLQ